MLPHYVRFFPRNADFNTVIKYKLQLYADLTVSFGAISTDTPRAAEHQDRLGGLR